MFRTISQPRRAWLMVLVALVVVISVVVTAGQRSVVERASGGLELGELRVEPGIVMTGHPVRITATLRNGGSRPARNISAGEAVSTDQSPGMTWRGSGRMVLAGLPHLNPGDQVSLTSTLVLHGDGFARVGLMVWSDADSLPPVAHRVLVIDPLMSIVQITTLIAMLAALTATALVIWPQVSVAPWSRRARARLAIAATAGIVGITFWMLTRELVPVVPPAALRGLAYSGIACVVLGWIFLFLTAGYASRVRALSLAAITYTHFGATWVLGVAIWGGLRPTAAISASDTWSQVASWPLHFAQAVLGLRFI